VRDAFAGAELHEVYWVLLGDLENDPPTLWGPHIQVRPVPPQFDYAR
jgi:hypothetical protein